ncbi:hypothetical protein VNO78_05498 [Psophocarpus tetragonolobus]|uniref:Uncharacterized protein n=1 Tax=Psophocarpus tetragonolobus TaxID=3891 RepID=A0AAN9SR55_PSOTE
MFCSSSLDLRVILSFSFRSLDVISSFQFILLFKGLIVGSSFLSMGVSSCIYDYPVLHKNGILRKTIWS